MIYHRETKVSTRIGRLCRRLWPFLVLGLLVGLFFWRLFLLNEVLVPADLLGLAFPWKADNPRDFQVHNAFATDVIDTHLPARAVAVESLRSGQLPLWDPYTSSGRPLGVLPVYSLFFPLNVLLLVLPLDVGFSFAAVGRLFIAGAGMFAFLRQLGLGRMPALAGAVIFAFNGFLVVWLNAAAGSTLPVVPLVFWAGERLFRRPSVVNVALLALSVAVLISGGFLAVVLFALYSLAGYLAFRSVGTGLRSGEWWQAGKKLIPCALGILIGIVLMTPVLWSFWDHLQLTGYDQARATWLMKIEPLYNVVRYLVPDYYGTPDRSPVFDLYPERTAYVGILPLFLAALGATFNWQRHTAVKWFVILGLVAFGAVYVLPIRQIVSYLPGMRTANLHRARSVVVFCLAALAAYGLEFLGQHWRSARTRGRALAAVTLVAVLQVGVIVLTEGYWAPGALRADGFDMSLWRLWVRKDIGHPLFADLLLYLLWALGSAALLVARAKGFLSRRAVGVGALLLVALDLGGWGMTYFRPMDRGRVYPQTPGITFLQSSPGLFRVTGLQRVLFPNTPGVYGLQDIVGHDPLASDRYREFLRRIDPDARFGVSGTVLRLRSSSTNLSSPLLDLLNLRYIAAPPLALNEERIPQDGTYTRVYQGPDMIVYENSEALPRAYVVGRAEVVPDPETILWRLETGQVDPREVVLLEEEPPKEFRPGGEGGDAVTPDVVSYTASRVIVQVEVEEAAILVLSDMYYPGWEASVDGQPAKTYRANYLFRAVLLPPGEHVVEFAFRPHPYLFGQGVRCLTVLGMAVALICEWRGRRRARRSIEGRQPDGAGGHRPEEAAL